MYHEWPSIQFSLCACYKYMCLLLGDGGHRWCCMELEWAWGWMPWRQTERHTQILAEFTQQGRPGSILGPVTLGWWARVIWESGLGLVGPQTPWRVLGPVRLRFCVVLQWHLGSACIIIGLAQRLCSACPSYSISAASAPPGPVSVAVWVLKGRKLVLRFLLHSMKPIWPLG